jgi:F-type H+-transporting ATPase subunit delta
MEHKNIVSAEISTASKLDKETLDKLYALTVRLAGGKVELSEKVDADLIGGFVLRVGDNMIDTSVSGSIKSLEREFAENPYVPVL